MDNTRPGLLPKKSHPQMRSYSGDSFIPSKLSSQPLMRRELGEVLRQVRLRSHLTLREVSMRANVSLGYLSEVERGQKEVSSELLAVICTALRIGLSTVLFEVSARLAELEGLAVPDSVPDDLLYRESVATDW